MVRSNGPPSLARFLSESGWANMLTTAQNQKHERIRNSGNTSRGVMLPKTDALLADIENFRIWRAKRARRVAPASSCAPQAIFLAPERPILMIFTHFCAQRSSMRAAEFVPGKRGPRQNHVHEIRPFQARPQLYATLTQCTTWTAQSRLCS